MSIGAIDTDRAATGGPIQDECSPGSASGRASLLTPSARADLAARARHLYERIDDAAPAPTDPGHANVSAADRGPDIEAWRERWVEAAADGDATAFRRRLAEDGIDEAVADRLFAAAAWPKGRPLPSWCAFLSDALAGGTSADAFDTPLPGPPSRYPFHALLRPLHDAALRALSDRLSPALQPLLTAATRDNAPLLLRQLCQLAAPTLHLEFTVHLSRHDSELSRAIRRARGERSDVQLRAFVAGFDAARWRGLLAEYPVLARQLAETCERWIDTVAELVERWHADRDALRAAFADIAGAGEPVAFTLGQSDRHNGGRSTAFVAFADGARLVYKPKSLQTDAVVADLLAWLQAVPGTLPMRHVPTLQRDGYGWQAWVAQRPCTSVAQFEAFHVRMGYLLALVYALEGYDYHYENLIADGDMPLLVDTETLFNPHKEMTRLASGQADASVLAAKTAFYSVLRTGFLPIWTVRGNGVRQDLSGLGGDSEDNDAFVVPRWQDADTDDIRLAPVREPVQPRGNRPTLADGTRARAEDHVDALRSGFAHAYRALLARRDEFLARLERHAGLQVRFVRRATRLYAEQLQLNQQPAALRDGMAWSLANERQARLYVAASAVSTPPWGLLRAEYRALMALDIPWFRTTPDGLGLEVGNGNTVAPGYFDLHVIDRLRDKLALLGERDLALQDRYIAYCFHARAARSIHGLDPAFAEPDPPKVDTRGRPEASPERCLELARGVADALLEQALRGPDGSLSWVALEYIRETDLFQLKPISYNLYSGGMGVALFFAALGRVSGEAVHVDAGRRALAPLLRIMREEPQEVARLSGLGIGVGLGSLIYGLAAIAELDAGAEADDWLQFALQCALGIDDDCVRRDLKYDLMFGTTGALLALDKLRRVLVQRAGPVPADTAVAGISALDGRIRALAQHLREAAAGADGRVPTYEGRAVTGFSHGSAGVALALARAAHALGDAGCADAAMAHVAFEEALYDAERGNYPDYRSRPGQPAYMTTWCHGAPGIGLSRIKHHALTGDATLLAMARRDMAATHRFTLVHLDHTCCGSLGRLDIQWEAARMLGDDDARGALRRDLGAVLEQRDRLGGFRLFLNAPTQAFAPGLFTGAAGIAHTLLRFAAPGRLPCVLAFD